MDYKRSHVLACFYCYTVLLLHCVTVTVTQQQRLSVHFNLLDEEDAALLHKLEHGASLSGSSFSASGHLNRSIGGSHKQQQQQHHGSGSSGNNGNNSSSKLVVEAGDSEVLLQCMRRTRVNVECLLLEQRHTALRTRSCSSDSPLLLSRSCVLIR
jgi:hypothetical protein